MKPVATKDNTQNNDSAQYETESLSNHTRQELKELAKNLSDGKYQKHSPQRDKLMKLLVKQLSFLDESK